MKFVSLLFLLVMFAFVKGLILAEAEGGEVEIPTFSTPIISTSCSSENTSANATCIEIFDLSGGCGGFTDCIEYVGNLIWNIGAYFVWIVLLVISLVSFVVALLTLLAGLLFEDIPDAPEFVSLGINAVLPTLVAVKVYRLLRSGDDD